jgi:hypothetical protein
MPLGSYLHPVNGYQEFAKSLASFSLFLESPSLPSSEASSPPSPDDNNGLAN